MKREPCVLSSSFSRKEENQNTSAKNHQEPEKETTKPDENLDGDNKKEKTNSFKVLFIDEAQDLSLLQWEMVRKIWSDAEKTYIAGDDDQAIFKLSLIHI